MNPSSKRFCRLLVLFVLVTVVPVVGLLLVAVVSGMVRTAVLLTVWPLVVLARLVVAGADAAGRVIPAPRLPQLMEVP